VDYQIGRVKIINPAIEASNAPIQVSVEQNSIFNQQRTSFLGVDIAHNISDNFVIGASYLRLSETPFTQKVNFGQEPLQNQIFGFNTQYSTESGFLSKIANRLPFHKSDAPSNFSIRGDVAYLLPGTPKRINVGGEAASYIDDFEGTQTPMNIRAFNQWFLASTPQEPPTSDLFNLGGNEIGLAYGKKRARLAWYNIDNDFYGSNKPDNIDNEELSRAEVRTVLNNELFPEEEQDLTESRIIRTLDLAFYPHERGSYNYDIDNVDSNGRFTDPENRWAGITRAMIVTDFESSNVEYLQFWIMDPFEHYSITQAEGLPPGVDPNDPNNHQGEIYINLGNISEDILKDNRKIYENGLPVDGTENTAETFWGIVPTQQAVLYAFDNDDNHRLLQDIGLDGLDDQKEKNRNLSDFPDTAEGQAAYNDYQQYLNFVNNLPDGSPEKEDPSCDNFHFYKGSDYDDQGASILQRYKNFSRTQGNSPTASLSQESYPTASTQYPDTEDINKDQTMSTVESFYQYRISLNPTDLQIGQNYIVDKRSTSVTLPNGQEQNVTWYQFRIPLASGEPIGGINGFNSIRFMRIFLTKFRIPVVLRFAQMELVRGQWRRYKYTLEDGNQPIPATEMDNFESGVVNIEENNNRQPIPYVLPPGVERERIQGTATQTSLAQNEQSLSLVLRGVAPNDGRALFKNVNVDLRMFKHLKMFIHAESKIGEPLLNDEDLVAVIRLGSDLSNNFYQIEKPLKITPFSATSAESIWPEENNLNVDLDALKKLKLQRYNDSYPTNQLYPAPTSGEPVAYRTRVKGHPNLGKIKTIMLGIINKSTGEVFGEVWFNELRASGYDNEGGWASVISADGNITDMMDFSFTGRLSTRGYGNVDQNVNERSQEDIKQYDVATNINLGKFTPDNWGLQIPLNVGVSEEIKQSKYDAQYQDILLEDTNEQNSPHRNDAQDYTRRRSISLINVKKNFNPKSKRRQQFYDFENLSFSYAYNETYHRDYNIQRFMDRNVRAAVGYNYSFRPWEWTPFNKLKTFKGKSWKFIKDFNFNPLPTTLSANSNIIRSHNEQHSRSLVEDLPPLPVLRQRNYLFDWDYTIGFKPFKSLRVNFNAANHRVYDNFNYNDDIGLYDNFFDIGRPTNYNQKLDASYQIPIDKFPYLDFIKSNYSYTADFDWQGASHSLVQFPNYSTRIDRLTGNTIQNANSHNLQVDINMKKFYKNIGLAKVLRTKKERKAVKRAREERRKILEKQKNNQKNGKKDKLETRGKKTKKPYKPGKPKTAGAKVARAFYDLLPP
jgi:cell surface protein SprA